MESVRISRNFKNETDKALVPIEVQPCAQRGLLVCYRLDQNGTLCNIQCTCALLKNIYSRKSYSKNINSGKSDLEIIYLGKSNSSRGRVGKRVVIGKKCNFIVKMGKFRLLDSKVRKLI